METDNLILFLPFIAGIIIAVTMKSIKAGIGTAAFAGAITLFVSEYFIAGGFSSVLSFLCFYDIYKIEKREWIFKHWLADCISRGKLLGEKRNSADVNSDNYMVEASALIEEVNKTLYKYKREPEIVRVVGGLRFNFDELNSVNDSVKDKYKKAQIGHVILSLADNLIELQEREKGN